ncbi:MAG TPA: hypothetical protein VIJ14_02670 [Rhabdochlamydiaceae bacterium]
MKNMIEELEAVLKSLESKYTSIKKDSAKPSFTFSINPISGDWDWQEDNVKDLSMDALSPKIERRGCSHSWKTYEGFTQKYDYCVHCDEKKA